MNHGSRILLSLIMIACIGAPVSAQTINDTIVDFCRFQLGKQVGDGECTSFVVAAFKSAGAMPFHAFKDSPKRGDFVWGRLIVVFAAKDGQLERQMVKGESIQPGDVAQLRDVKLERKSANSFYTFTFPQHTSVVAGWKAKGHELSVFEQNINGNKEVMRNTYRLDDLKEGWIRVYRPMPAKQTAEEKSDLFWNDLSRRCRDMLDMQRKLHAEVVRLQKIVASNPGQKPRDQDKQAAIKLAKEQSAIVAKITTVIAAFTEEEAAVAFPDVFKQLREDMLVAQRRLAACDLSAAGTVMQTDIIEIFEEMVPFRSR